MKIIAYSFSDLGGVLGDRLSKDRELKVEHRRSSELDKKVSEDLKDVFYDSDAIIFIGATGIAVRLIAPFIKHKSKDPAIICIDDKSRFIISLLSGHLGGANSLTERLAEKLDAIPVITTASDSRGIEAIDLFAQKNDYHMENMKMVTEVTRKMVDGKNILFFSERAEKINYNNLILLNDIEKFELEDQVDGAIIVTSKNIDIDKRLKDIPVCILRPKNLNIGIGCKKDMPKERIIQAIEDLFSELNLSTKSIKNIGSVEVKKNELGIIEAAKYFGVDFKIFTIDEIGKVDNKFNKSEFVKKTIGVYSVAEPSAYLLGGEFLSMRTTHEGITLSVTKEENNG